MRIASDGNEVLLTWQAVTGKVYFISGTTNLQSAWQAMVTGIVATNTPGSHQLETEAPEMFFKVGVE